MLSNYIFVRLINGCFIKIISYWILAEMIMLIAKSGLLPGRRYEQDIFLLLYFMDIAYAKKACLCFIFSFRFYYGGLLFSIPDDCFIFMLSHGYQQPQRPFHECYVVSG